MYHFLAFWGAHHLLKNVAHFFLVLFGVQKQNNKQLKNLKYYILVTKLIEISNPWSFWLVYFTHHLTKSLHNTEIFESLVWPFRRDFGIFSFIRYCQQTLNREKEPKIHHFRRSGNLKKWPLGRNVEIGSARIFASKFRFCGLRESSKQQKLINIIY